jgi:hypothetical protein
MDYTRELSEGDRLRFEHATVEARKITNPTVISGSGSHRTQRVVCSKSGILFVDKPWRVPEEGEEKEGQD